MGGWGGGVEQVLREYDQWIRWTQIWEILWTEKFQQKSFFMIVCIIAHIYFSRMISLCEILEPWQKICIKSLINLMSQKQKESLNWHQMRMFNLTFFISPIVVYPRYVSHFECICLEKYKKPCIYYYGTSHVDEGHQRWDGSQNIFSHSKIPLRHLIFSLQNAQL